VVVAVGTLTGEAHRIHEGAMLAPIRHGRGDATEVPWR
jgi:hypothetical protein